MKSRYISWVLSAGVAVGASAYAETAVSKDSGTNVVGIMNFKTGAFTPLPRATSREAGTEARFYGWVIANITAVNKSKIPTTANASCSLSLRASDSATYAIITQYYSARGQVTETMISCTVKVPYLLYVSNQSTTAITINPTLYFSDDTTAAGASRPAWANIALPEVSFPLPSRGSTTVRDFSALM